MKIGLRLSILSCDICQGCWKVFCLRISLYHKIWLILLATWSPSTWTKIMALKSWNIHICNVDSVDIIFSMLHQIFKFHAAEIEAKWSRNAMHLGSLATESWSEKRTCIHHAFLQGFITIIIELAPVSLLSEFLGGIEEAYIVQHCCSNKNSKSMYISFHTQVLTSVLNYARCFKHVLKCTQQCATFMGRNLEKYTGNKHQ